MRVRHTEFALELIWMLSFIPSHRRSKADREHTGAWRLTVDLGRRQSCSFSPISNLSSTPSIHAYSDQSYPQQQQAYPQQQQSYPAPSQTYPQQQAEYAPPTARYGEGGQGYAGNQPSYPPTGNYNNNGAAAADTSMPAFYEEASCLRYLPRCYTVSNEVNDTLLCCRFPPFKMKSGP